jgi:hypothetical protein
MCEFCDKLNTISTKHPIQFTCHWADNNHTSSITSDLTKCTVEILDDSGRPEMSFPITRCPVCGDPIVPLEQCKTFEDVVKREG